MAGSIASTAYIAMGAVLVGDVTMGAESSVFHGSVLRGEAAPVDIAPRANVQDNCIVEGTPGHPARIGAGVSMGHNARVYGATIEEYSLIAIGATILPGAHVSSNCIIAANATVPEGMHVPPGMLVIGDGRLLRPVTEAETHRIEHGASGYVQLSHEYRSGQ